MVAELRPDLILAVSWRFERKQDDDLLAQIAPTVAQDGEFDFSAVPWQASTCKAERAVGRPERGPGAGGATQGRDVFLVAGTEADLLYAAVGFQTVLSLPLLFDELVRPARG